MSLFYSSWYIPSTQRLLKLQTSKETKDKAEAKPSRTAPEKCMHTALKQITPKS